MPDPDMSLLEEVETEEVETTTNDEVPEPEPDRVALLEAEVARLKSLDGVAGSLRHAVGRIQSLEAKLEANGTANQNAVIEQINKQFGSVTELLANVVENIDETALDSATKQRVREAYSTSQKAAERASLRDELIKELKPPEKPAPQEDSLPNGLTPTTVQTYERAVVRQLERAGLDPDSDYDWKAATALLVKGGSLDDLLDLADKSIETAQAANRRQAAKRSAGAGSPSGASPSGDAADRLGSAKTLDEGVALLRQLGVNV